MKNDDFGNRMKGYEHAFRHSLPRRLPVLLRLDGCHFHTFTRGLNKPFDAKLTQAFWETCKYLAGQLMGCKLVYHQSDEISILLTNNDKLTTQAWYDNNIQKMVSVSAAMVTAKFNDIMRSVYPDKELAFFDSRAWVLPEDEVTNYFLWRQQDATKNSISMVAQAHFPQSELQGLDGKKTQDKLFTEKGINWNELPVWQKRGVCITKQPLQVGDVVRNRWEVDHETPVFSQNRAYINQYVYSSHARDKDE
ncbi:tRNA(His) guanylyltransferase Thg1 family protein [Paenibacillus harenae]|uniref:tRNA(His) 5'-end guanylyltransferase n=1 Tax=Paenibacillus harenae TaxID=306543 RepID=A0ABT9TV79_PAEHA|nr:tRNA(His) guanylyltransferase Thg1 family protein [Paenibacillus harenae]MDQ0111277.1 tRNA(His) 5'-end guanylyltransferase [Paenibacillus harenae]